MESPYPRPPEPPGPTAPFAPDRVVGILLIVFYGLCLVCSGIGFGVGSAMGSPEIKAQQQTSLDVFLMVLSFVEMVGAIAAGIGIILARAWGFIVGIIATLLIIGTNIASIVRLPEQMKLAEEMQKGQPASQRMPPGFMESLMSLSYVFIGFIILLHILLLIYCIFRLTGKTGPKPL